MLIPDPHKNMEKGAAIEENTLPSLHLNFGYNFSNWIYVFRFQPIPIARNRGFLQILELGIFKTFSSSLVLIPLTEPVTGCKNLAHQNFVCLSLATSLSLFCFSVP